MKKIIIAAILAIFSLNPSAQTLSKKQVTQEKNKKEDRENATIPMQDLFLEQQQQLLNKLPIDRIKVVGMNNWYIRQEKMIEEYPTHQWTDHFQKSKKEMRDFCKVSADSIVQTKKELLMLKVEVTKFYGGKAWPERISNKWKFNEDQANKSELEDKQKNLELNESLRYNIKAYVDYCLF